MDSILHEWLPTSVPADWLPDSGSSSPAWRWLRAEHLAHFQTPLDPRFDDEWVGRARRLVVDSAPRDDQIVRFRKDPLADAAGQALDVWRSNNPYGRWKLEALLLTSEPLGRVAHDCQLPAIVVQAYHQIFFEVRPHLEAANWIAWKAVGCGPWNNFGGEQPGGIWKFAGYTGGAQVLDIVISLTTDGKLPAWFHASFADEYEARSFQLRAKLTLAAMMAKSDKQVETLLEAHNRHERLDRRVHGTADKPSSMMPAMERFLAKVAGRKSSSRSTAQRQRYSPRKADVNDVRPAQTTRTSAKLSDRA